MTPMDLFFSANQRHPFRLIDLTELFMVELRDRGVRTRWFAQGSLPGRSRTEWMHDQPVRVPAVLKLGGPLGKVINKVLYWCGDAVAIVQASRNRPDIIQVRDKYIAALAGLLAARLTGARFTYWLSFPFPEHDMEMAAMSGFPRKLLHLVRGRLGGWLLYRVVMPHADHVFVQSGQMKLDLMEHGVPAEKMTPVPMGVAKTLVEETLCADKGVVPGRVVYLGTLARVRRMETLVRAMAQVMARIAERLPEAQLYMVGDSYDPSDRAFLESETERLGLRDRVVFTGFLPMEEAWEIVRSAAVCVSPIYPTPVLRCGSPTKLVEYMALGRPVVANDHPEQTQIIAESGAGLCVPWSEEKFADAIIHLLEHPEEAEEMGAAGREWVRRNRTYDRIADMVYEKYCQILAQA